MRATYEITNIYKQRSGEILRHSNELLANIKKSSNAATTTAIFKEKKSLICRHAFWA